MQCQAISIKVMKLDKFIFKYIYILIVGHKNIHFLIGIFLHASRVLLF